MFEFLSNLFKKNTFKIGLSRKNEIEFCTRLGSEIRAFKESHYNEYTWDDVIEEFVRKNTNNINEYDRLRQLMTFFTSPEDKRLQSEDDFYETSFPKKDRVLKLKCIESVIRKNIDNVSNKDAFLSLGSSYNESNYEYEKTQLLKKYNLSEIFKDWKKQTELKDHEIYNFLYEFSCDGILEKKKEKNRVYYKYNNSYNQNISLEDVSEIDSLKKEYIEDRLEQETSIIIRKLNNFDCIKLRKSQKSTNTFYDELIDSDFFNLGKGVYPIYNTPFTYVMDIVYIEDDTIDSQNFISNPAYDKVIKSLGLFTFIDFKKCREIV